MATISRRIYIDTNVLINYCTGQTDDVAALNHIFKKRRKEVLYTSTLAAVQTVCNLQTAKKTRKAFSREEAAAALGRLTSKITMASLEAVDVEKGLATNNEDIEDNVHFAIAEKLKCDTILTNNISDFSQLKGMLKISPQMGLSLIKMRVK